MIQYVRNEKNVPIAVFVADQMSDRVAIGFAVCNDKDTFSKDLGKTIALGRAHKFFTRKSLTVPARIATEFLHFLGYCADHPASKDKLFPRWFYGVGEELSSAPFPGVIIDTPKAWNA